MPYTVPSYPPPPPPPRVPCPCSVTSRRCSCAPLSPVPVPLLQTLWKGSRLKRSFPWRKGKLPACPVAGPVVCLQIIRGPGAWSAPTDSYKETHNLRLLPADSLTGGQVSASPGTPWDACCAVLHTPWDARYFLLHVMGANHGC